LNGLDKGALMNSHHHVDGVKVLLTSKAAGKVSLWIGRGMKVAAHRA